MKLCQRFVFLLVALFYCAAYADAAPLAYTATLLHPPEGYSEWHAHGISGTFQVGFGRGPSTGEFLHALLWNSTDKSFVDLTPTGFVVSLANAIDGNTQVGSGRPGIGLNDPGYALMWHGTVESVVNLHSPGFYSSHAQGVAGDQQVGSGRLRVDGGNRALWWNGTAESVVDLHPYLADLPVTITDSFAHDIDDNGMIVGRGWDSDLNEYAILWTPIPEPTTALLFIGGLAVAPIVLGRYHRG